ncbi:hypothetical protein EVAR_93120_1 [Eumeta japonica]|uniref:Uncharacterized protein n=1 Tax=Eumeta variegata TaxID=151549 RepID=A0A4C1TIE1_EUMVA|nr:hypothetical protein EVAR_93120_1 [Eumeta japonica]
MSKGGFQVQRRFGIGVASRTGIRTKSIREILEQKKIAEFVCFRTKDCMLAPRGQGQVEDSAQHPGRASWFSYRKTDKFSDTLPQQLL